MKNICITEIMQKAYIEYSMSVIINRALPDARDGLKPVQRRILYAMFKENLLSKNNFDKCAGVVGEVLKNYHPHGDSSVYDALVRLAQSWIMRYPLIDPQGNFGSIDGDPPAAYRYTECKLKTFSEELMKDIDKNTVPFMSNYKDSLKEPIVLPAALPNLLLNGSKGIAVGMTTNIPPHNISEVIDACCALIKNPDLSIEELSSYILGPDFPTGGAIYGIDGIKEYLSTGRGIIYIRGIVNKKLLNNGKIQLVISELPYNLNRSIFLEKIGELMQNKVLDEIHELRDESDTKTRIIIEIKKGFDADILINKLFKYTQLESSFGVILLALDGNSPKEMNIKDLLICYIKHRKKVIKNSTKFKWNKSQNRLHILNGFQCVFNNYETFMNQIKNAKDKKEIKQILLADYKLSENQIVSILDMRLYQLTSLEINKFNKESKELISKIKEYEKILLNNKKLDQFLINSLQLLKTKYLVARKTKIILKKRELTYKDLVKNIPYIITISEKGLIKKTELSTYKSQKRGGKGILVAGFNKNDFIRQSFIANTHETILFFMNNGRVYIDKVSSIPQGMRLSKGRSVINLLDIKEKEQIEAMICIEEFDNDKYIILTSKKGIVKKTKLMDYSHVRRQGIIGIIIDNDDCLVNVQITNGKDEVILITHYGYAIRFDEEKLRIQGRVTRGVKGIKLQNGDFIKAMEVIPKTHNLTMLIANESGQGKRTSYSSFRNQDRGGKGIRAMKTLHSGIAGAISVENNDDVMLFTKKGNSLRMSAKDIRIIGRVTKGVKLINLNKYDKLINIRRILLKKN